MFDRLVESTRVKQRGRSGRFLFLTGLIYSLLLSVLAVWTIMGFSPGLAADVDWARLTPPVPLDSVPAQIRHVQPNRAAQAPAFKPTTGETPIPRPETVLPTQRRRDDVSLASLVRGSGRPSFDGATFPPVGSELGVPVPPPPAAKPKPTPEPPPEVKPPSSPIKISDGVTQGLAVLRVKPQYPAIAKAAHIAGAVQVQVLISEEGRVIEAEVRSGHPLLRQSALDAARQWVFRPTLLSKVPVRVQGLLTFDFALN